MIRLEIIQVIKFSAKLKLVVLEPHTTHSQTGSLSKNSDLLFQHQIGYNINNEL